MKITKNSLGEIVIDGESDIIKTPKNRNYGILIEGFGDDHLILKNFHIKGKRDALFTKIIKTLKLTLEYIRFLSKPITH